MYQKINYSLLWIYSISFLIVFASCKDKSKTYAEESSETTSPSQTKEQGKAISEVETQKILGNPIKADSAKLITDNYVNTLNASTKQDDAKSVYFTKAELDLFAQKIVAAGLCSADKVGFRLYFAKYAASDATTPFRGKNTIVIRATCDGKDIPHQIHGGVETVHVAYDFGDVCPPRCDLGNPDTVFQDGSYNVNGNCNGCPN